MLGNGPLSGIPLSSLPAGGETITFTIDGATVRVTAGTVGLAPLLSFQGATVRVTGGTVNFSLETGGGEETARPTEGGHGGRLWDLYQQEVLQRLGKPKSKRAERRRKARTLPPAMVVADLEELPPDEPLEALAGALETERALAQMAADEIERVEAARAAADEEERARKLRILRRRRNNEAAILLLAA